jgi:hypothetical protein
MGKPVNLIVFAASQKKEGPFGHKKPTYIGPEIRHSTGTRLRQVQKKSHIVKKYHKKMTRTITKKMTKKYHKKNTGRYSTGTVSTSVR